MRTLLQWITVIVGSFLLGWWLSGIAYPSASEEDTPLFSNKNTNRSKQRQIKDRVATELTDVDACRALLAASKIKDHRHPLLRQLDRERALKRWILLDPESALLKAEQAPSSAFAKDLFLAWIGLNPSDAMLKLKQGSTLLKRAIATHVFIALFQKNARLAADELQSPTWQKKSVSELGYSFHGQVYQQWALSGLDSAIAYLSRKQAEGKKFTGDEGQLAILKVWARKDLQGAWSFLFPEGEKHSFDAVWCAPEILASGLLGGAKGADELLKSSTSNASDGHAGMLAKRIGYIATAMVRIHPQRAIEWAKKRAADDPLRPLIIGNAAKYFATSDPDRALSMLQEAADSLPSYRKDSILRESFAALTARDLENTASRVSTLPDTMRKDAMSGYLTNMFASDPTAAATQCRAWLNDPALAAHLPAAWAKSFSWSRGAGVRDPSEMLKAVPALNDAVDGEVLSTWAKAKPKAAAGWIKQRLEGGHTVDLTSKGVVADLAIQEPAFTAAWINSLPASDLRAKSANTLVANWAAFDPDAARAWIDSLPQGALRTSAEAGFKRTFSSR